MMRPGMKNGDTRRGPVLVQGDRGLGDALDAADAGADHHAGRDLLVVASCGFQPASSSACVAAHIA